MLISRKVTITTLFLVGAAFLLHETLSYYWGKLLEQFDPAGERLLSILPKWQVIVALMCIAAAVWIWVSGREAHDKTPPDIVHITGNEQQEAMEHIYSMKFESITVPIDGIIN